ncbi:hypothetical protein, partial [Flavobacterium sp.]|uniref:hypothetical protein n=1 Tax=Flavobacterium sp. TaxID=239 RepID=UPI003C32CBAE
MKKIALYSALLGFITITSINAQETTEKYTAHNKGKFFISWGGNRDSYSKSDITFKGKDYNFTLDNVIAHDRPKGWHVDYINPGRMTIPQTNFRMGYFINDHYSIAVGVDHMKYVMTQDRVSDINGDYVGKGTNLYDETVGNPNQVLLTEKFLTFEHTDGLNYVNTEFSRHDDISKLFRIQNTDKIQISFTEGVGVGLLFPKTNAKILGKERHDDFHISGFGTSIKAGLNITFFKHFYLQGELKGGYINMPDIRTTISS